VKELFPSDFVVSLSRPENYMGTLEFFDIGDAKPEEDFHKSNQKAFVRPFSCAEIEKARDYPAEYDSPRLLEAIDSFILAGSIKLWREEKLGLSFKHHTMLINTDYRTDAHEDSAIDVEQLLNSSYATLPHERIRLLWEKDFQPVSLARNSNDSVPEQFEELTSHINATMDRIVGTKVLVVNCKNSEDTPDFNKPEGVWAILVGGAKLSRGYTIEGLTTTYFCRRPSQLDTLVQMARWYGFRPNYQDLVRLYIAKEIPGKSSKGKPYPLLDAFRFGARVEEAFRENLIEYGPSITPEDIPPLVQYEFKDFPEEYRTLIKPTASNKMRNTVFLVSHIGGRSITTTRIGGRKSREKNTGYLEQFLGSSGRQPQKCCLRFDGRQPIEATVIDSSRTAYLDFLKSVEFKRSPADPERPNSIQQQISALETMTLEKWRIVFFWPKSDETRPPIETKVCKLPRWGRGFNVSDEQISVDQPLDPKHRPICAWLAEISQECEGLEPDDPSTSSLRSTDCGIFYLVPFSHKEEISNPDADWYFLWSAYYPGKGRAGAYRVSEK